MKKINMFFVLVCIGFLLFVIIAGCSKTGDKTQNPPPVSTAIQSDTTSETGNEVVLRKPKPEEIGIDAVCPVMGTKFKVTENNEVGEYKGKTYYFCCPECPPLFQKDPAKYVK